MPKGCCYTKATETVELALRNVLSSLRSGHVHFSMPSAENITRGIIAIFDTLRNKTMHDRIRVFNWVAFVPFLK